MEVSFPPPLPFDLIWHSQHRGVSGRLLLLQVLGLFFFSLPTLALEIYHCSHLGLFFFFYYYFLSSWHMEIASLEKMQSVSRFKQAPHTRGPTSHTRLRFLATLSTGLVLQLLWDVESTQSSFREVLLGVQHPQPRLIWGVRLCAGVCAVVLHFPNRVGKPGGEGIFTQRC